MKPTTIINMLHECINAETHISLPDSVHVHHILHTFNLKYILNNILIVNIF